jgi:trimeric autotransporter adhesin
VSYSVDADAVDKFLRIPDSLRVSLQGQRVAPKRQTGFVAQEVEAIVKKTGYVFHGVEAPQSESDHYSIQYAEFVVPLVKAVQELTGIAESQQKEIAELKEQLTLNKSDSPASLDEEHSTGALLFQNSPNPFTVNTQIKFSLPETVGRATIIIYNMEGKQLKVVPISDRGNTGVEFKLRS